MDRVVPRGDGLLVAMALRVDTVPAKSLSASFCAGPTYVCPARTETSRMMLAAAGGAKTLANRPDVSKRKTAVTCESTPLCVK